MSSSAKIVPQPSPNSPAQPPFTIRAATGDDFPTIWSIFHPILVAGETLTYPPTITQEEAYEYWFGPSEEKLKNKSQYYLTRVATIDNRVVGVYAIRPCYPIGGPGSKIANGSYIVDSQHRGKGLARAMGVESLIEAKKLGYKRMQFNQVVETNPAAVKVWTDIGMKIVGRSPGAFVLPNGTEVDLLIMNKEL